MTPCNWPTAGCPACDGSDCLTKVQRDDIEAWAISDLWEATGRVYGTCPVSVLPCNVGVCGSCRNSLRSCGCGSVSEVKLPGPVAEVTEVIIDGVTLDDSAYRIDDYQWLVRLDGGTWPRGGIDPDGFRVDYLQGIPPPAGAAIVTGILACSRSSCNNGACKVPKGTTQVSRQGVTMIRGGGANSSRSWRYEPDSVSVFGITEVDQWVGNANRGTFVGAVHSPDLPTVRRITWEATP